MTTTSQTTLAMEIPWERHKDEIRGLYVEQRLKLPIVMQLMGTKLYCPTKSMWKKQLTKWQFDVHNHKYSTMVAAAACYQQCKDRGQPFHFAARDCKAVSEQELMRYLKRKGLVIIHGALVPRASLIPAPATTPASHLPGVTQASRSTFAKADESTGEQLEPFSKKGQIASKAMTFGSTVSDHCRRARKDQFRKILAFQVMERFVCPTDLIAPDPYYNHENVLRAVDCCITSSWDAGMWAFTDYGGFRLDLTGIEGPDPFGFGSWFSEANHLLLRFDSRRARKVFTYALFMLHYSLLVSIPYAIRTFLSMLIELWDERATSYLQILLNHSSSMVQSLAEVYPGLSIFFAALSSIEPDALLHVVLQAYEVYAGSFRGPPILWTRQRIIARLEMVQGDHFLESGLKIKQLTEILTEVRNNPDIEPTLELYCLDALAWTHIDGAQWEVARQILYNALDPISSDRLTLSRREWAISDLYYTMAWVHLAFGDTASGIEALEISIEIERRLGGEDLMRKIRTSMEWKGIFQREQAVSTLRKEYNEIIDELVGLDLEGEDINLGEVMSTDADHENRAEKSGLDETGPSPDESSAIQDSGTVQDPAEGQKTRNSNGECTQAGWRKEVMKADRLTLALPLPDFVDDEGP